MECNVLGLYGPESSKYLHLVERRAEAAGIETAWVTRRMPECAAYMTDTESDWALFDMDRAEDVDAVLHDGLSCAAQAAMNHMTWAGAGKNIRHVCIVGTGHAVQGLREELRRRGYHTEQFRSSDPLLRAGILMADAVICAVRQLSDEDAGKAKYAKVVVDISGAMAGAKRLAGAYVSRSEVGAENIRQLLRRVEARTGGAAVCR